MRSRRRVSNPALASNNDASQHARIRGSTGRDRRDSQALRGRQGKEERSHKLVRQATGFATSQEA
ncbi:hypothetical protein SC1_01911 [Sphingopyxis sp. C-1]|nr:hypothetical protein SC1_01911 [Sphingopyxis sp. C-1]